MLKHKICGVAAGLGLFSAPVSAQQSSPPVVVYTEQGAKQAFMGVDVNGFGLKTLLALDVEGTHTSLATIQRNKSETSGLSHDHVTEIYKILDGEATLITGGRITDGKAIFPAADPAVGPSHQGVIEGGKPEHVKAGDIVVIAPNTPHEFVQIDDHITYVAIRVSKDKY
jgi:mannose-6-phosphate isomerase-like protein (cupin superfamily)